MHVYVYSQRLTSSVFSELLLENSYRVLPVPNVGGLTVKEQAVYRLTHDRCSILASELTETITTVHYREVRAYCSIPKHEVGV